MPPADARQDGLRVILLVAELPPDVRVLRARGRRITWEAGQEDIERRAAAGRGVYTNDATILRNNAVYDGEPHARAFPHGLRREEGLENMVRDVRRYARAPVLHTEVNIVAMRHAIARKIIRPGEVEPNRQLPRLLSTHGMVRVAAQVENDLVNLAGIAEDAADAPDVLRDLDAGGKG